MTEWIDHYAVMGNPVAHSLSPRIHRQFAEQTGQQLDYIPIQVPLDGLAQAITQFRSSGGRGVNITVPFKEVAYRLADVLSKRARTARAVNTLSFIRDQGIHGDNTDGIGLFTDLTQNLGLSLKNRRILLLGAGGAARGVAEPLLAEKPLIMVIANRTKDRATDLANDFKRFGPISGQGFDTLQNEAPFDLIINATAASLSGKSLSLPENILSSKTFAYDMVYAAEATPFMRWAVAGRASGTADGLGMLVEQAAESFFLWRGIRPNTPTVIADLRAFLNGSHT